MKKNKSVVQNILANSLACIALLAGCAGFTEDGNSISGVSNDGLSIDIAQHFAAARVTRGGSADIDEAKDSVTFVLNIWEAVLNVMGCLFMIPIILLLMNIILLINSVMIRYCFRLIMKMRLQRKLILVFGLEEHLASWMELGF